MRYRTKKFYKSLIAVVCAISMIVGGLLADIGTLTILAETETALSEGDGTGDGGDTEETPTLWFIGGQGISTWGDANNYYYLRDTFVNYVGTYLDGTYEVRNLGDGGASAKNYLNTYNYAVWENEVASQDVVVVGFGVDDSNAEEADYSNPNSDYQTVGGFQNYLYEYYVKVAQEAGAEVILATPGVKRATTDEWKNVELYNYEDTTVEGVLYERGDYPAAIRQLATDADVPVVDLTTLTKNLYDELGVENTLYLHAWRTSDAESVMAAPLNSYGAKTTAWLFANAVKEMDCSLADHVDLTAGEPSKEADLASNPDYVEIDYDNNLADSIIWPDYTVGESGSEVTFKGTVFGDFPTGGISTTYQTLGTDASGNMNVAARNSFGKISSATDGLAMYYYKVPVGSSFVLATTATVNALDTTDKACAFGLMARDDMYIDYQSVAIASDYVVAGTRGTGCNDFYRYDGSLNSNTRLVTETVDVGSSYDLCIEGSADGFKCYFGNEPVQNYSFDNNLNLVDSEYIYIGMFAARNADITYSDIYLEVDGAVLTGTKPEKVEFENAPTLSSDGDIDAPMTGDTLTVNYSLKDVNTDTSAIYWYQVDGNKITLLKESTGSGDKTYTIADEDAGYGIKAVVVPNNAGTAGQVDTGIVQRRTVLWVVGGSRVSTFPVSNYYYPRESYAEYLGNYLDTTYEVKNLGVGARSSKSYLTHENYTTMTSQIQAGDTLLVNFGHKDRDTTPDHYTSGTGDYQTQGSYAYYLHEYYVKVAQEAGAEVILCTPAVTRPEDGVWGDNNLFNYGSTTVDGVYYERGDYAEAVRQLGEAKNVPVVDLTTLTKNLYDELGTEETLYLQAWVTKESSSAWTDLHNELGAKYVAWLFANAVKDMEVSLAGHVDLTAGAPTRATDLTPNPDYEEIIYDNNLSDSILWPDYVAGDVTFKGTVFGSTTVSTSYQTLGTDADGNMRVASLGDKGKIAGSFDGLAMYYYKIPVGSKFVFSAKAKVNSIDTTNKQVAFGLMARDDMYIDFESSAISSDYVAAGTLGTGCNSFYRYDSKLSAGTALTTETIAAGSSYDLCIEGNVNSYNCYFGSEPKQTYAMESELKTIDSEYIYIGMFAARNADISYSDIYLEVDGEVLIGEKESHTLWTVGGTFIGKQSASNYYYLRDAYPDHIAEYLDGTYTVQNLGFAGHSSKSFMETDNYTELTEGIQEGDTLLVSFGHKDGMADANYYVNANGDYQTKDSFAYYLYEYYVKLAQDAGANVILCTPVVEKAGSGEWTNGAQHITADNTINGVFFEGGDYPAAIRQLGKDVNVPVVDMTALTKNLYDETSEEDILYLNAWRKNNPSTVQALALSTYGAKMVAWLFANAVDDLETPMASHVDLTAGVPDKASNVVPNPDYIELVYNRNLANSTLWADYTVGDLTFKGSVFGDFGYGKINTTYEALETDADGNMHMAVYGNNGKISGSADGIAMYYYRIPADSEFVFSATADVEAIDNTNNQVAFGLMARDDMYIDTISVAIDSDYVVAGTLGRGCNGFYRNNGELGGKAKLTTETVAAGKTYDLCIEGGANGYNCYFGNEPVQNYTIDSGLKTIDSEYIYVGMIAVRNVDVTYSNIYLEVDGQVLVGTKPEKPGTDDGKDEQPGTDDGKDEEPGTGDGKDEEPGQPGENPEDEPVNTEGLKVCLEDPNEIHVYSGGAIKPAIIVTNNGEDLIEGIDYSVKYTNNVNASVNETNEKKKPLITVTAKGNLTGSTSTTFEILPRSLEDDEVVVGSIVVAEGSKATPVLLYCGKKLTTKDYTVEDAQKKYTEDDVMEVTGKGNFTDSIEIPVSVVSKKELKKFAVSVDTKVKLTYDGTVQIPDIKVYDKSNKSYELEEDEYTIVFSTSNINAGVVKFTVIGMGEYTGTVSKSYRIRSLMLKSGIEYEEDGIDKNGYTYNKAGVTINDDIVVKHGETVLVEGKDYKVTYSNNKKVSKEKSPAKFTIKFMGNYNGSKSLKGTFMINSAKLSNDTEGLKIVVPNKVYSGKPGTYVSKPYVSIDGVSLKNSDYKVTYYMDAELTNQIKGKNKLSLDKDEQSATVYVKIEGKGNYADDKLYATAQYKVQRKDKMIDLSKAKVTFVDEKGDKLKNVEYTGNEVNPNVKVEVKGEPVDPANYTVTYVNNINKGNAIVVINATGDGYVGSKTAKIKIVAQKLKKDNWNK